MSQRSQSSAPSARDASVASGLTGMAGAGVSQGPHQGNDSGSSANQPPSLSQASILNSAAAAAVGVTAGPNSTGSLQNGTSYRPLNVKDALSYLDQVKVQFHEQPDVYNKFLDIMKDFKSQSIDTPGVIDRVSTLFRGHPNLIQGFNTFLPPGYRIECSFDPSDPHQIRVTTPMGTTTHNGSPAGFGAFRENGSTQMAQLQAAATGQRLPPQTAEQKQRGPVEFNHAINYVKKIKNRFANQPDTYKIFLEILQTYQREQKPIQDVYSQVTVLFKEAPDLLDDFKQFLPESNGTVRRDDGGLLGAAAAPKLPPVGNFAPPSVAGAPKERKKRNQPTADSTSSAARGGGKRSKFTHKTSIDTSQVSPTLTPALPEPLGPPTRPTATSEELAFFDRVKKFIGNKASYNEFLKVLNLFSQDILDINLLVEKVEGFLGGNRELLEWFKRFVGWDGKDDIVDNVPQQKHRIDLTLCKSNGLSYRQLPKSETLLPCSGRDEMCWEVLNDEWVSHPTWASEDSGFVVHKKNQFEEALAKIEEERHEYDHNIESNLRTIQLLEPIAQRIANMTQEEKASFKLPPGLGGQSNAIYQRLVKKIYDRERGAEVIDALHDNPAVAVPVILRRLKQKDEEWKRAQREWNKVWRETQSKVYHKSLDHQGIYFKLTDKKSTTSKTLLNEIEARRKEQRQKLPSPLSNGPKFQFQYDLEDQDLHLDTTRLIAIYVERGAAFSGPDRERMSHFLKSFLPLFFSLPSDAVAAQIRGVAGRRDTLDGDTELGPASAGRRRGGNTASSKDDLLRNVLTRTRRTRDREDSESRATTPEAPTAEDDAQTEGSDAADEHMSDATDTHSLADAAGESWIQVTGTSSASQQKGLSGESLSMVQGKRITTNMFANSTMYVLMRLYHMLYSRLATAKALETSASNALHDRKPNKIAVDLGLQTTRLDELGTKLSPDNVYQQTYEFCEKLIEGELEQGPFEDNLRYLYQTRGYQLYTVDKLIQSIVKQMHAVVVDSRMSSILRYFERDRLKAKTTPKEQIVYRVQVESILGADETPYRIEWNEKTRKMNLQLLGKEDLTLTNVETQEDRWNYYIDSYVMSSPTEGVPIDRVRTPFLRRTLPSDDMDSEQEEEIGFGDTEIKAGLEIKICLNTYKMFFQSGTEDVFVQNSMKRAIRPEAAIKITDKRKEDWKIWLAKNVKAKGVV